MERLLTPVFRHRAAGVPSLRGLTGLLSIGSFAVAVFLVGPDLAAPLVARSVQGAEIPGDVQTDHLALAPARVHPGADLRIDEFFVHIPAGAREPLTALVALHGMGGNGGGDQRPTAAARGRRVLGDRRADL